MYHHPPDAYLPRNCALQGMDHLLGPTSKIYETRSCKSMNGCSPYVPKIVNSAGKSGPNCTAKQDGEHLRSFQKQNKCIEAEFHSAILFLQHR